MDKEARLHSLKRQCFSIPDLCETQIAGVKKGLENTIPKDVLKNIRRVIITGCGDSYLAGIIAVPAFKHYVSAFGNHFSCERCIDVARNYPFDPRYAAATLVVAVSASGGPKRVTEALKRANAKGCHTLVVTNRPESLAAQEAKYNIIVGTPATDFSTPGLRNYYASLMGLFALAAYMGEAKGLSPEGSVDKLFDAIREFTKAYEEKFDYMDKIALDVATKWKDLDKFESIGDDVNWATAYFVGAKFVECAGLMCPTMDSEDWCHVNYFAHDSRYIGTIVVAEKDAPDRSRVCETVHQARNVARPTFVTADCPIEEFGITDEGVDYCEVPKAPEGFAFLSPMLNYIPGSLVADYIADFCGEVYFRKPDAPQNNTPIGTTISTSNIEVVD